jgi:hypothetical protein
MSRHNVYRHGRVHVCEHLCSTCIFRPGNLMMLRPGRVREMVKQAREDRSTIVCHQTLSQDQQAACRGFYDRCPTEPLQLAKRLDVIEWVKP